MVFTILAVWEKLRDGFSETARMGKAIPKHLYHTAVLSFEREKNNVTAVWLFFKALALSKGPNKP